MAIQQKPHPSFTMSNDLRETQVMTDAQPQAQPNVVSPTNSRRSPNSNYNRGRYGAKKLVGDIAELEDSVFVTAEENKDRKYSHRSAKRRIKSLITQTLIAGHNDFRKMWDGVKDPEVAIPEPEIPPSLLTEDPIAADEIRYNPQSKNNEVRRENFLNNLRPVLSIFFSSPFCFAFCTILIITYVNWRSKIWGLTERIGRIRRQFQADSS